MSLSGIFYIHVSRHDEYSKANRFRPYPEPTIVRREDPDKYWLMSQIANPHNGYFACESHGTSRGIKVNNYKWLSDNEIEELMRGRQPFKLVILAACNTGSGQLPNLFSKNRWDDSVVIAPTSTSYSSYSSELGRWLEASANEPDKPMYNHWRNLMMVGDNHKTPLRFFGSDVMTSCDVFVDNHEDYALMYQAHVQDVGWQDWVNEGEVAGTTGQSKRLEAIRIKLVRPQ